MPTLTPQLTTAVEQAAKKLLDHFKDQYGSLIFLPLGVNASTPAKIAPTIAQSIETTLLEVQDGEITVMMGDDKVGQVFDTFINSFFNSLNFIAKGVMKALGMKMLWADFASSMEKFKTSDPTTYERWKKNLTMVLDGVFTEVIATLKSQTGNVKLTDGAINFESLDEAIKQLKIFA